MQLQWAHLSCEFPVTLLCVAIAFPSTYLNLTIRPEIAHA
jgi:hypothetical protein